MVKIVDHNHGKIPNCMVPWSWLVPYPAFSISFKYFRLIKTLIISDAPVECRIVEVREYLKFNCTFSNGTWAYKCTHSDIYYHVPMELCDVQVRSATARRTIC